MMSRITLAPLFSLVIGVANAASFTPSPSSLTSSTTGNVITLTGTATAWTGSPFTVSGGLGPFITSQNVTSGTAATITVNAGLACNGNLTVTDTISGATATITISAPSLGAFKYGAIGDSITQGTNGNPIAQESAYLTCLGYTVTANNQGVSGSYTAQWVAGSSNLNAALSSFASTGGITIVQVTLGTNDTWVSRNLTPAQHAANMASLVGVLLANGYQVIINKPIFTVPNAFPSATLLANDPNILYEQYFALDMKLVDGVSVFQGDTGAFSYSSNNSSTFLATDGVHPKDATANNLLGNIWGTAMQYRWGNPVNKPRPTGHVSTPGAQ